MSDQLVRLLHEWEIAKLPHTYARAIDRRDKAALGQLFTPGAQFERHPKPTRYYDDIVAIPDELDARYTSTFHAVLNQTFAVDGDRAEGEVYCIAQHMFPGRDGLDLSYDLRIRYEDRYKLCEDGRWRFEHRRVHVDARTMTSVALPDDPPPVSAPR